MAEYSPMMQKYLETKKEYEDCVLFYRLGDFYEMFCEDAKLAAKELELTVVPLTVHMNGKDYANMLDRKKGHLCVEFLIMPQIHILTGL